jgi:hypothetical protein
LGNDEQTDLIFAQDPSIELSSNLKLHWIVRTIRNLGYVRAVVAALDPLAKLLHTRRSHRLQQP